MDNRLAPIKLDSYQPLREVVCESLREAIRKGILKPGERIMEIQLAEELGVSRTPVRESTACMASTSSRVKVRSSMFGRSRTTTQAAR